MGPDHSDRCCLRHCLTLEFPLHCPGVPTSPSLLPKMIFVRGLISVSWIAPENDLGLDARCAIRSDSLFCVRMLSGGEISGNVGSEI